MTRELNEPKRNDIKLQEAKTEIAKGASLPEELDAMPNTVPPHPDQYVGDARTALAALGIEKAIVEYDGYGDEGFVEDIRFEPEGVRVPRNLIDDFVENLLETLPGDWEINDGSFGEIEFDIAGQTITYCHKCRYTDYTEENWTTSLEEKQ